MQTECPLCEDYLGSDASVQAHISGSKDEVHSGFVGRNVIGGVDVPNGSADREYSDVDHTAAGESDNNSEGGESALNFLIEIVALAGVVWFVVSGGIEGVSNDQSEVDYSDAL